LKHIELRAFYSLKVFLSQVSSVSVTAISSCVSAVSSYAYVQSEVTLNSTPELTLCCVKLFVIVFYALFSVVHSCMHALTFAITHRVVNS